MADWYESGAERLQHTLVSDGSHRCSGAAPYLSLPQTVEGAAAPRDDAGVPNVDMAE